MKVKTQNSSGYYQAICDYLNKYAYIPEMKADGSAFEKRKIESAVFSADKTQLVITGAGPDFEHYTLVLKNQRKVYSRTDRGYDKIIIRGFVSVGEDFSVSERQKLIIYLKGYPSNTHVAVKLRNELTALMQSAQSE
jgi:hypothetical protein